MHVREVAAANGELAAQVVAGRNARQHLHGAKGIVGEDTAQVLDVGAAEDLLRGRPRIGHAEPIGTHRHGF